jgi:hypothetical protein
MEMMKVAVGSKRPIPVFAPNSVDMPDGNVIENGVVYIPLTRASEMLGHRSRLGLYRAVVRKRVPYSALRQKVLPDGCRLYISLRAFEDYKATRAFRKGRPRKSA